LQAICVRSGRGATGWQAWREGRQKAESNARWLSRASAQISGSQHVRRYASALALEFKVAPLCSRLLVTCPALPRCAGASDGLCKLCCFCCFQTLFCANLRAKRAQFASFKKVMLFVFKYFLASFPLFFIFWSSLHSPIAGTLSLSLASRRTPATFCPEQHHHGRLSHPCAAVKRKMQQRKMQETAMAGSGVI